MERVWNSYKHMRDVWWTYTWIKRPVSCREHNGYLSHILTFSSLQTLRSISRISGWVAGAIERNRRSKRDRDRWCPSRSPRRTPLFRKRATLPSRNRVLGQWRSSARRRTLAYPPPLSLFTLVNVDDRYEPSNLASGISRRWRWRCRPEPPISEYRRDNYFYLTLPFLHLFSFPNPAQFELRSPFCPNRFVISLNYRIVFL